MLSPVTLSARGVHFVLLTLVWLLLVMSISCPISSHLSSCPVPTRTCQTLWIYPLGWTRCFHCVVVLLWGLKLRPPHHCQCCFWGLRQAWLVQQVLAPWLLPIIVRSPLCALQVSVSCGFRWGSVGIKSLSDNSLLNSHLRAGHLLVFLSLVS